MAADPTPSSAAARQGAGTWRGRPAGMPGAVPPPSVPLSFLAAASLGLVACGGAWMWAADAAAQDPTADPVVAAAHLGMLATLSMGVLGALHQFTPVVSQRPLRSIHLARATFLSWLAASWLLPLGIATGREALVETGGGLAALSIAVLVVNLSKPLAARHKGAPVIGLRFALAGFVATACFGVLYVADRRGNWFDLSGHVVLAHAVIGLFAWLGLTYASVAEKLWPMFFLAHVPGRRWAGRVAVWAIPAGVALLSPGLLLGIPALGMAGAGILAGGLGAHVTSLLAHVRHRRRPADLHLLFVLTSACWLVAGAGLALGAVLVHGSHQTQTALVAAAVCAFGGWLLETLVGHAHKVVPFIGWSAIRARGTTTDPTGKPIMFSDLYDHTWAAIAYGLVTAGIAALCIGLGSGMTVATEVGGGCFVGVGLVVAANLSIAPLRMMSAPLGSAADGPRQEVTAAAAGPAHPTRPVGAGER